MIVYFLMSAAYMYVKRKKSRCEIGIIFSALQFLELIRDLKARNGILDLFGPHRRKLICQNTYAGLNSPTHAKCIRQGILVILYALSVGSATAER